MIHRGSELAGDLSLAADVCVVGCGAGGSVAAATLAAAGLKVVVLEKGGHHPSSEFTQREDSMYPLLYEAGGNQTTADRTINVMQGTCVGGSTVVNMADCVDIPEAVFEHWRVKFGVEGLDAAALAESVGRVRRMLNVNRIPDEKLNENHKLLKRGIEALGWKGECFENNRTHCRECGYCLLGCAYDAKRSALVTWVPAAVEAGAEIYADCRADRLLVEAGRAVGVEGRVWDAAKKAALGRVTVQSKVVVLAGGSIRTASLLLASGVGNASGEIGRNLSLQPQAPILALFSHEIRAFRGVPQAYACTAFDTPDAEHGLGGFRIEGVTGGPAMGASLASEIGLAHKERMIAFPRMAASLLLVPDRPSGSVTVSDKGKPKIDYEIQSEWVGRMKEGMRMATRAYLAAGAQGVHLPFNTHTIVRKEADLSVIDERTVGPSTIQLISAHPQGTCRMGKDAARSVVDCSGESHEVRGLFVMDASLFPTTASSHTMIPVMAVADLFSRRMLARRAMLFG